MNQIFVITKSSPVQTKWFTPCKRSAPANGTNAVSGIGIRYLQFWFILELRLGEHPVAGAVELVVPGSLDRWAGWLQQGWPIQRWRAALSWTLSPPFCACARTCCHTASLPFCDVLLFCGSTSSAPSSHPCQHDPHLSTRALPSSNMY